VELTERALRDAGYDLEADAVSLIRRREHWSPYVAQLVADVQHAARKHGMAERLRFLLYPKNLLEQDRARIAGNDAGVIWL
jgi:hypothetical protein